MVLWTQAVNRRSLQATTVLCCLGAFFLILLVASWTSDVSDVDDESEKLERQLAFISNEVEHLRFMDRQKSKVLMELRQELNRQAARARDGGGAPEPTRGSQERVKAAAAARQILHDASKNGTSPLNASFASSPLDVALPSIYDFLPHLLNTPENDLVPAMNIRRPNNNLAGYGNRQVDMVIAVPTVKRPKVSYLVTTLRSLFDNLSPGQGNDNSNSFVNSNTSGQLEMRHSHGGSVLVILFVLERFGAASEFVKEQVSLVNVEFGKQIEMGLLEVVVPPAHYYPPDLDEVTPTFDDSPERMLWRTKQNLDYAYMMMYCQRRALYYLQLEDDVITKPNYVDIIMEFMRKHSQHPWFMLEFSSLGFIGKFFRTRDLPLITQFILMFHKEKPVDWLLDHVQSTKYCHLEKSNKECTKAKKAYAFRMKPSLFQHIGMQSSLRGKVQKLKEKDFGKPTLHRPHSDNPPASASTSLKTYQKYNIERAYNGESIFWALLPQAGDFIRFDFDPPVRLEGFTLRSGNAEHPDDQFYNTTVSLMLASNASPDPHEPLAKLGAKYELDSDTWYRVANFSKAGAAAVSGLNTTRSVASLRLVVHSESEFWVILSEIWVRPIPADMR